MKSYTYLGTADDVVRRYPWKHGWDISSIDNQLIHSVIYDKKLVINDGYIVANPELLQSLNNLNTSLLGNVLSTGHASLFCRGAPRDLADGILKNKEKLDTFRIALDGVDEIEFRGKLETLQKYVAQDSIQWPRDKNTGAIFGLFLEKLANDEDKLKLALKTDSDRQDFMQVYTLFSDTMDKNFKEARQEWERICWQKFGNFDFRKCEDPFSPLFRKKTGYDHVQRMMHVANEAYHVAYTCALSWSLRGRKNPTAPLTSFCPAYMDVFESTVIEEGLHKQRYEGLGSVLISVNPLTLSRFGNYSWIREIVLNNDIKEVRENYVKGLEHYINWKGDLKQLREIAKEYRCLLAKAMADEVPTLSSIAKDVINFFGVGQCVSALQAVNNLARKIARKEPMNLDPVGCVKEFIEIKEIEMYLERTGLQSTWYGDTQNLARDLGLINARLAPDKVRQLLDPIEAYDENA